MTQIDIYWQTPLWLALVWLPLVGAWWLRRSQRNRSRIASFADAHLLSSLIRGKTQSSRHIQIMTLACVLALLAAADPLLLHTEPQQQQRRAVDIALVVDISPSMMSADVPPSRLQRAKWEVADLVKQLENDRLALITFSANAYVTLPLTHDKGALLHFVNALESGLASRKGSNLGRALALAAETLAKSVTGSRAIVVLSDGEDHGPNTFATAEQIGASGIPIFALGIGTDSGAPVPQESGQFLLADAKPVVSHLRRDYLSRLAQASGGVYSDFSNDDRDWEMLVAQLDKLSAANPYILASQNSTLLFPWLLAASLALFLWVGRHRLDTLLCLFVVPFAGISHSTPALASPQQEQAALNALQTGDHTQAQQLYNAIGGYNGQLGLGVVAYRQQQWQRALASFQQALSLASSDSERARAYYNQGNTLAQMGSLQQAATAFEQALQQQQNYPRAALNLSLVQAEYRRRSEATEQAMPPGPAETPTTTGPSANQALPSTSTPKADSQKSKTGPSTRLDMRLEQIEEQTTTLLKQRFTRRDRLDKLSNSEPKPW